jgi:histidinol-phosphate aminotransferase
MKRMIKTNTFFNIGTQRALYERPDGYVSKEFYITEHISELKRKYGLETIYRLDLGQNNDGCDISVAEEFENMILTRNTRFYMKNYPEFVCRKLRNKIALIHGIDPEWIMLSAGLDQMIIMISSIFLELNDRVMINTPSFFLFEDYSKRMGGIPVTLPLKEEDGFRWTEDTFNEYLNILDKLRPKLIWLATPNNPTGIPIPDEMLERIVEEAANHYAFIVIDEAYGEYIDPFGTVRSASRFLRNYNNVIVLRTFSKGFGLANLRVAYAMLSDISILDALRLHRPYYPITQISFDYASLALDRFEYIEMVRQKNMIRKFYFLHLIRNNKKLKYIESETSVMMLRHLDYTAAEFIEHLEKQGIIVSKIPGNDNFADDYVRITLSHMDELEYFASILEL